MTGLQARWVVAASLMATTWLSTGSARAQAVHVGYAVPLDGGTGGLEAGGGFRFEFLDAGIGVLGVDLRVLWTRTTLNSALPGQQSKWLSGNLVRGEVLA